MTAGRRATAKAKGRRAGGRVAEGAVGCGSLPPARWSLVYKFYEHGDVLMRIGACRADLEGADKFLTKTAEAEFQGAFSQLLDEVKSGRCNAYLPPHIFRFEYYELNKWGEYDRNTNRVDSESLAKVLCGAYYTLVGQREGQLYFILLGNPEAYAESVNFVKILDEMREERKKLPYDATTAVKRLYLSRVGVPGVLYEVVVEKGSRKSVLKSFEAIPTYNLSCYQRLRESLEKSAKYLHDEDAYNVAVEVAESLEAYFETGRVEHLYDALRVLHGVANKENCDAACRYARALLPGIREVVERGPC